MAAPQGVCVAFADGTLDAAPTWVPLTGVTSWTIERGRSYELDKTGTGTATVTLIDTTGKYDPTNPGSPYAGQLDPMKQAAIALQNPVDSSWNTLFTGFVADWNYSMDTTERYCTVTLELVDAFDLLAAVEMTPGDFGDTPPAGSEDDIYFDGIYGSPDLASYGGTTDNIGPGLNDDGIGRINQALNDANWPAGLRDIFSGNVALQDVVYARRDQLLAVIFDCADAEFPGVSNVYMSRDGKVRFRGRLARFNPTDPQYGITFWPCGDNTAALASSAVAPIFGLDFNRGKTNLINAALALPAGLDSADVPGALVKDDTSIATYGRRSVSYDNLLLAHGQEGPDLNAVEETTLYAQYYVDNYAAPRTRVSRIRFGSGNPTGANGPALWNLICGIEISDLVTLTTTHPGGGGFDAEDFYVEGIHYSATPMTATYPNISLELDVSPRAYYDTNPF